MTHPTLTCRTFRRSEYKLPWEDDIVHKDGQAYGFKEPRKK